MKTAAAMPSSSTGSLPRESFMPCTLAPTVSDIGDHNATGDAQPLALPRLVAPSISIVICNFNYARFLQEAIDSALAQSPPCQVIVVDDGSTDDSRRLLAQVDSRVEVVLRENGGQLAAYNSGFARCTGEVVFFLDADDVLLPHASQAVGELFEEGVVKVHFRLAMIDEHGGALGVSIPATLVRGDVLPPLLRHGLLYPSAPGSGNAYRRSVLERLFPLPVDPTDRVAADFFVVYGSVAYGRVAACDDAPARYRMHRVAQAAGDQLVFGNAALGNDEAAKVTTRDARLREWIAERTDGAARYAPQFLDFSIQKSVYAQGVMAQSYFAAIFGSGKSLFRLLKAVWLQPSFGFKKKCGLSVWALLVLVLPRGTALRLARYVCNPASRRANSPAHGSMPSVNTHSPGD